MENGCLGMLPPKVLKMSEDAQANELSPFGVFELLRVAWSAIIDRAGCCQG